MRGQHELNSVAVDLHRPLSPSTSPLDSPRSRPHLLVVFSLPLWTSPPFPFLYMYFFYPSLILVFSMMLFMHLPISLDDLSKSHDFTCCLFAFKLVPAQIRVPGPYILLSSGHLHEMSHSTQNCMYHLYLPPLGDTPIHLTPPPLYPLSDKWYHQPPPVKSGSHLSAFLCCTA